jgi:hypothetical protein
MAFFIGARLKRAISAAIEPRVSRRAFSIAFTDSANYGWVEERVSTSRLIDFVAQNPAKSQ